MKYSQYTALLKGSVFTWLAGVRSGKREKILSSFADMLENAICAGESIESFVDSFEGKSREYCIKTMQKLVDKKLIFVNDDDFETPEKIKIILSLSRRCNLQCRHCCVSGLPSADELSNVEYQEIVNQIILLKPDVLVLTGGEPLLRNNFREIVSSFKAANIKLSLMTNGTLITSENVRFLIDSFDSIDISIDGYDEQSCSILRGKNVFQRVINSIRLLQREGFHNLTGSFVVTKDTFHQRDKFVELCKELNIEPVVRGFTAVGRGELYKEFEVPSRFDDQDEITKAMSGIKNSLGIFTPDKWDFFVCDGAFSAFYIDYDGSIYPCPSFAEDDFKLGNIRNVNDLDSFFLKRNFVSEIEYQKFFSYFPHRFSACNNCTAQLMCFKCARELKEYFDDFSENRCRVNKHGFELSLNSYEEQLIK